MIAKLELINYSKRKALNLGQAEKDYFQNLILFIIYSKSNSQIIFKGGTALQKCYGLERFSEDLDFNASETENIKESIEKGFKEFFIEYEITTNEHPKGRNITLRIKGPLYNGSRNSLCKILIDLSFREKSLLPPKIVRIGKTIEELPSFDLIVMNPEEILAEKIRAIFTRDKTRDIYDLSFLLDKKINQNKNIIEEKLRYDKIKPTIGSLLEKIKQQKKVWEIEMKPLLKDYIDFNTIFKNIKTKLKKTKKEF